MVGWCWMLARVSVSRYGDLWQCWEVGPLGVWVPQHVGGWWECSAAVNRVLTLAHLAPISHFFPKSDSPAIPQKSWRLQ